MTYKSAVLMFAAFALCPAIAGFAQEKKEEAPPMVVKRAPAPQKEPLPTTDKYPVTDAVRALESGEAHEVEQIYYIQQSERKSAVCSRARLEQACVTGKGATDMSGARGWRPRVSTEQIEQVRGYRTLEDIVPALWTEGSVEANGVRHHYWRTGGGGRIGASSTISAAASSGA